MDGLSSKDAMSNATAFVISHESNASRVASDPSSNNIALTLTRALGRAGVKVVRVHPNLFEDSLSSRYCQAIEICPDLYQSESDLTAFLAKLGSRYPGEKVLIPASDDCSQYIARNAEALCGDYTLINPSAATMERVGDKRQQYELATEVGVPIPETYFPENDQDLVQIANRLNDFPYIIKPLEAQKWRLKQYANVSGGQKAITVNDRDELIEEYRRISANDNNLMVQEIITGKDEHLITFLGYCSTEQKPLAHCIRSKLRQSPIDFGYCTATVSCHNDIVENYSMRLLKQSNYTGIVGIEFKFEPHTNDYKLIEINTRPVNTIGISIGCGVNLPVIAYRDAIGLKQEPITDWEDGVIWLRLSQDFAAARELRLRGRLTFPEWLKSLRGKRVHAIYSLSDPVPFIRVYSRYVWRQLGKLTVGRHVRSLPYRTRRILQRVTTAIF
jgi:predicted ATP-grasp superfamily ATP-dependent carboligase